MKIIRMMTTRRTKTHIHNKMISMKIIIKIILAALLVGCLRRMPDNYYQLVRFSCFVGFTAIAYLESKTKNILSYLGIVLAVAAAILFNPFDRLTFRRYIWQQIDLGVGITLGVWILSDLLYLYGNKLKEKVYKSFSFTINIIKCINYISVGEVLFIVFLLLILYAIIHFILAST